MRKVIAMNSLYLKLLAKTELVRTELEKQGRVAETHDLGFVIAEPKAHHDSIIDMLILTVVHGNEPGGMLPVLSLLQEYADGAKIEGRIGILICNREAALEHVRFVEKDLNRCFGVGDTQSLEGKIAHSIEPLILRSKYLIDLHQTNYETKSDFFIFPDTPRNVAFASQICGQTPIIVHGMDFSKDGYTSDTFAVMNGVTAITYEMGQIGKTDEQLDKTRSLLKRAIGLSRTGLKNSKVPAQILEFSQVVTASTQKRLIPNLINMDRIKSGEIIGHDEVHGPIFAKHDGYILFPKYGIGAEKSSELCHVVKSQ